MNKVKVSLWPLCVCMVLLFSSFSFANENVRLIHSQFTPYFDNGFDFAELEGAIEVKNIGYNKAVWLHYEATDGTWKDHPAYWVGPSKDGYEVFTFRLPLEGPVGNVQFAVKYEVNGKSYWDNNDSQNYQFDGHQQTYFYQQFIALDDVSRSS